MKVLHDAGVSNSLLARARRLHPSARPVWGTLSAERMLCHVADVLRVGLQELEGDPVPSILRYPPINFAVIYVLPWPKGAPSFKEAFNTGSQSLERDVEALARAIAAFRERPLNGAWPPNPLFGRIGGHGWSRLMYRHIDHHLRQFGV